MRWNRKAAEIVFQESGENDEFRVLAAQESGIHGVKIRNPDNLTQNPN
jgi:hypothetical protein